MIMKTPNLDHEIQRLKAFKKEDDLSEYGKELLTEYEAIKKQLNLENIKGLNYKVCNMTSSKEI
jgi:hypothetical protein